ncbi:MFS transporter [Sphingomonas baiyangensis]|uniref:MFS transporter n=2 Tax=Sphingomonas baiyangensis TaxID=2572576 RepID=A0A4U1L8M4_9SPHN|nr:MFS transporter [Sphingomonas baiyangensis]
MHEAARSPVDIDVAEVIERQRPNGFVIRLILLSWTVTFFDGFDMLLISFVAPYIREEYGADAVTLGQLFACGTFGAMLGGIAFGWLGDRFGRRPMIIASVAAFGLSSIAIALVGSMSALMVARFVNGITLGGLMPLAWALNIEYVPTRFRATVVTVIMLGYTLGGVIAGPVTVWMAPSMGWQSVFLFSGLATLLLVALLLATLPESARYLAVKNRSPERIAKALNAIEPGLGARASDRFGVPDETPAESAHAFRLSDLFKGHLRQITLLIWLAYIGTSMAIFFKSSWGPILFEEVGFTRTQAAMITSASSVAGAVAGLVLMRFTDRFGPIAIAVYPVVAIPLLLLMGLADIGLAAFAALTLVSMAMISGTHVGMHSISGIFYPSAIRANGAGWATSIAKIGSISAPLIGGYLLATSIAPRLLFVLLAATPALSAVALLLLGRQQRRMRAAPDAALPPIPAIPPAAAGQSS